MSLVIDPLPTSRPPPRPQRRPGLRWIAIGIVSLLIHLALLDALPRWSLEPEADPPEGEPLRAVLMPPIQPVEPVVAAAAPAEPPPRPAAKARAPIGRTTPDAFAPESFDAVPEVAVATVPGATPAAQPAPAPVVTQQPGEAVPSPPVTPPVVPPRSARLSYKVVSVDLKNAEPTHYYGVGSIDWSTDDGRYRSELNAALQILFIKVGVLASTSEGLVTPGGLAPDRYTETPRKRATLAVNFNRDARQSVTFSSSAASAPLTPGAQDRLSVLFQIGALLLADTRQAPRIDLPVAGVRGDVDTWSFDRLGLETLETGAGPLATTHLRRTPRPGTNDRTIDVWIAQSDGGYPARVLYTEPNGTTVEMTLDSIGAVPGTAPISP